MTSKPNPFYRRTDFAGFAALVLTIGAVGACRTADIEGIPGRVLAVWLARLALKGRA